MKRTIIIVVIAFGVLLAGCGGPGDAPENESGEPVDEEPGGEGNGGGAGDEDPGDGGDDGAGNESENASVTAPAT